MMKPAPTPDPFLDVALAHHALGRPVIPVQADKRPACEAWGHWRYETQTERRGARVESGVGRRLQGLGLESGPLPKIRAATLPQVPRSSGGAYRSLAENRA